MTAVSRPVIRWHGGKWLLAPWVISHMPPHRNYVEPFGGAASVLIRKPRSYSEVYNDLDGDVVNLFRILRSDEESAKLVELLRLTPFARSEFELAYGETNCAIERARRTIVRSFMGFGSDAALGKTSGFRAESNRSGTTPAHDWRNYPDALEATIARLSGVVIEQRPALDVITRHDGGDTLHYVDPPYVHSTRARAGRKNYRNEMTNGDHEDLLRVLKRLKGSVILSGYSSELYEQEMRDWFRVERQALADGARERTEVLWMNFDPGEVMPAGGLFDVKET